MNFWIGLIICAFVAATIGIILSVLLASNNP